MYILKKENNVRETDDAVRRDKLIKEGYAVVESEKTAPKGKGKKSEQSDEKNTEQSAESSAPEKSEE